MGTIECSSNSMHTKNDEKRRNTSYHQENNHFDGADATNDKEVCIATSGVDSLMQNADQKCQLIACYSTEK
jgi:hypothetical protein